jgi:AcrR family transcriptional regulator
VPYPASHRPEIRARIVQSARRLFNRHGFDSVSINRIMAGAGLTHGGFYSYFKSKNELYTEVLGCFFTDPNWKNCWEGRAGPPDFKGRFRTVMSVDIPQGRDLNISRVHRRWERTRRGPARSREDPSA